MDSQKNYQSDTQKIIVGVNSVPLRKDGGGMKQHFIDTFINIIKLAPWAKFEFIIFYLKEALEIIQEIEGLDKAVDDGHVKLIEITNAEQIFTFRNQFSFYLSPLNYFSPKITDIPSIAILADIQEQFFPQFFSQGELHARNIVYPDIAESSHCLVTISEFSKQTIVDKFKIDPQKIQVVYPSLSTKFVKISALKAETNLKLPAKYFVYPANSYPHKNHKRLLEAFKLLKDRGYTEYKLVLTGNTSYTEQSVGKIVQNLGIEDMVVELGLIDYKELNAVFKKSQALIFPSLFEGFGIPIIEFSHLNKPILCSDDPCLKEIANEAIEVFNPYDVDAIASTLINFIEHKLSDKEAGRQAVDRKFNSMLNATGLLEAIETTNAKFYQNSRPSTEPISVKIISIPFNSVLFAKTLKSVNSILPNAKIGLLSDSSDTKIPEITNAIIKNVDEAIEFHKRNKNVDPTLLLFAGCEINANILNIKTNTIYIPYIMNMGVLEYIPAKDYNFRFLHNIKLLQHIYLSSGDTASDYDSSKSFYAFDLHDLLGYVKGDFWPAVSTGQGYPYKFHKYLLRQNLYFFMPLVAFVFGILSKFKSIFKS